MSQTKAQLIDNLVQPITGALGSASAPTFSFTADPNTGVYSPGADQLALSTGGTGRLFVDASGNISNTAGFNPYATTNRGSLTINGTTSSIFALGVNGVAAGYLYSDAVGATIGAPATKNIVFDINGERARIDSSGRVGIGANPGTILDINDPGSGLRFQNAASGNFNIGLLGGTSVSDAYVFNRANSPLIFGTNNQERVRINSSGFLGVGTSSPAAQLHVYGTYGYFQDGTYTGYFGKGNGTVVGAGTADLGISTSTGAIAFGTGASLTERMRLDASGRLGVGTSSPNQKLEVAGGTIRAGDNQATNGSLILDGNYAGSDTLNTFGSQFSSASTVIGYAVRPRAGATGYTSTAGSYSFHKAALEVGIDGPLKLLYSPPATTPIGNVVTMTEMLRVDTAGRVGIGTASPQTLMHLFAGAGTAAYATFSSNNGSPDPFLIGQDASGLTRLFQTSTQPITFWTNSTERMRLDGNGRLLVGTSTYDGNARAVIQGNTSDGLASAIDIQRGDASPASGSLIGTIRFRDTTAGALYASIECGADAGTAAADKPGRLVFSTTADGASSPTERMRIKSSNNIDFFTGAVVFTPERIALAGGATTEDITVTKNGVDTISLGVDASGPRITTGGALRAIAGGSGGVQLSAGATSWTAISDEREKTNLKPIANGLDKISALRSVTGRYTSDEPGVSRSFLIAQDVKQALPEAVDESDPDRLGLRYSEVIPLLVAALKESKERIETLEAKVATLEGV